ncbi:MAG: hypothetical protein HY738_02315 [Bacteroidia bacterium]|nr:hypothetical protein [Bacteroidia bacterium]
MKTYKIIFSALVLVFLFSACEEDEPTPTRDLMQGVWELTEAYNANDSLITNHVTSFFPTFIHLDDNNSVNSTTGPLFMYVVYGKSRFVEIISKLDQAFSYADLKLTEGEFFMKKNEVVDKFTIEIKMKFLTMEALTTILELMGINPPGLIEEVIYHKFMDVTVEISDEAPEQMTWIFTDNTQPVYNIKDEYGNYVSWTGLAINEFSRCRLKFEKRAKSLTELVQEATENQGNNGK